VPVDRFDELAQRIAKRAMEDQAAGRPVRSDDLDPETVARRLQIAQTKLWPVVDHAGERGELVEVDAMGTPEEICETVQPLIAPEVGELRRHGGGANHEPRSPVMVRLSPQ
jgi:adenylate kinase family enzyme